MTTFSSAILKVNEALAFGQVFMASDGSEPEDSEYSSEEEDERVLFKPVFIPKNARKTLNNENKDDDSSKEILEVTAQLKVDDPEKKAQAQNLVVQYLAQDNKLDFADDELLYNEININDEDDVNPEEEIEAWKLRELLRIKRHLTEERQKRIELLEMEKLRKMDEEERNQYYQQKIERQKAEKEEKPKYQFLQKYYHKGAFFMDREEQVYQRDYNEPTQSEKYDKLSLPSVMQVRDFGKKSRSKWTHLSAEDSTSFDYGWSLETDIAAKTAEKLGGVSKDNSLSNKKRKT